MLNGKNVLKFFYRRNGFFVAFCGVLWPGAIFRVLSQANRWCKYIGLPTKKTQDHKPYVLSKYGIRIHEQPLGASGMPPSRGLAQRALVPGVVILWCRIESTAAFDRCTVICPRHGAPGAGE